MKTQSLSQGLTGKDRMGIFFGMGIFFFTLPVAIFVAAIPGVIVSDWFQSPVFALTIKLAFMACAAVLAFVQSVILGLAGSYFLSWGVDRLHLRQMMNQAIAAAKGETLHIETGKKSNYGAIVGAAAALVLFLVHGDFPIQSLTTKVEHLFPEPLVLSLGSLYNLNLSHIYAATTGFLAVGFLFAVLGIVAGSLVNAAIELTTGHRA